jgi:hypothetical protein
MKLTESTLRSIVKQELKKFLKEEKNVDPKVIALIKAMNSIRLNFDSKNMGQKVPEYKADADLFMIKDFIIENVADIDSYLETLKDSLLEQDIELDYATDDYSDEYLTRIEVY